MVGQSIIANRYDHDGISKYGSEWITKNPNASNTMYCLLTYGSMLCFANVIHVLCMYEVSIHLILWERRHFEHKHANISKTKGPDVGVFIDTFFFIKFEFIVISNVNIYWMNEDNILLLYSTVNGGSQFVSILQNVYHEV